MSVQQLIKFLKQEELMLVTANISVLEYFLSNSNKGAIEMLRIISNIVVVL